MPRGLWRVDPGGRAVIRVTRGELAAAELWLADGQGRESSGRALLGVDVSCCSHPRPGSADLSEGGPHSEASANLGLRAHLHPKEDVRPFLSMAWSLVARQTWGYCTPLVRLAKLGASVLPSTGGKCCKEKVTTDRGGLASLHPCSPPRL